MSVFRRIFRLHLCSLVSAAIFAAGFSYAESLYEESGLVRVHVVTEWRYNENALLINGRLLDDYNPTIIQKFSSPGVVFDREGHIMTFLGYGRNFVEKKHSRFEIATSSGRNYHGKLIGIDYGNGAVVIQVPGEGLEVSTICIGCDLRPGTDVIAPVLMGTGRTQFQSTQVFSINPGGTVFGVSGWEVRTSRPNLDIGQPLFTGDHRVLGFIVSQDSSGLRNVVYPIATLLDSAKKIVESNGDIRAGWLGIYSEDIQSGIGVKIQRTVADGPAQQAGIIPEDIVLKYNGKEIENAPGLISQVQNTPVGSSVKLQILRRGQPITLTANIQAQRYQNPLQDMMLNLDPSGPAAIPKSPQRITEAPRPRIGFDTLVLTPEWADILKIPREDGLLVVNVLKQSPADLAGLRKGDLIFSVNDTPADDVQKVTSYLYSLDPGATVSMKVLRNNVELVVDIKLAE